jgi:hypothetical protein
MTQVLILQLDEQVDERMRVSAHQRGIALEQSLCELLTVAASCGMDLRKDLAHLRVKRRPAGRNHDVATMIR